MTTFNTVLRTALVRVSIPLSDGQSHPFLGLLLMGVGLFNALKPEIAWYISRGWQFKDVEPSDDALWLTRVGGGVAIVIGLLVMF